MSVGNGSDDLLGWDWGWVVHPADLTATLAAWTESLRAGTPHEVEFRLRRHDGAYRWFLTRSAAVRDADGALVRWFGTCTDIDEVRRRADAAQTGHGLFRAPVERSEDGLSLAGPDGTVRFANPAAAARLLDFPAADLAGTDLWGSVYGAGRRELCGWLEQVLASPVRFTRRDGPPRWLEVLGTNLLPDPGVRAVAVELRGVDGN